MNYGRTPSAEGDEPVDLLAGNLNGDASLGAVVKELEQMYGLDRAGADTGGGALGMLERIKRLLDLDEGLSQ